jgi:hypothetical protein
MHLMILPNGKHDKYKFSSSFNIVVPRTIMISGGNKNI